MMCSTSSPLFIILFCRSKKSKWTGFRRVNRHFDIVPKLQAGVIHVGKNLQQGWCSQSLIHTHMIHNYVQFFMVQNLCVISGMRQIGRIGNLHHLQCAAVASPPWHSSAHSVSSLHHPHPLHCTPAVLLAACPASQTMWKSKEKQRTCVGRQAEVVRQVLGLPVNKAEQQLHHPRVEKAELCWGCQGAELCQGCWGTRDTNLQERWHDELLKIQLGLEKPCTLEGDQN